MWRLLFLMCIACAFWPISLSTTPTCRTDRISFTQDDGCLNDGSVEFCIPANDPAALETVLTIAPNTTCIKAGGRARCDLDTELLCLVETQCVKPYGAMTDAGWQTMCELSNQPFIRQIVPTWYE